MRRRPKGSDHRLRRRLVGGLLLGRGLFLVLRLPLAVGHAVDGFAGGIHVEVEAALVDGPRPVTGRAAEGEERLRLWGRWAEIDKNLSPNVVLLSELWQACFDAKYDMLQTVAMGAPVYDTGMLAAIRIAEVHKTMVLKKFEKYIVSYVLSGSIIRGEATPDSDVDVFIVIDDTDVKKMTRAELKDKLRAIIIGMGMEAGEMTGIPNKINIQVYILTDFWDSLREANPVIFTLIAGSSHSISPHIIK